MYATNRIHDEDCLTGMRRLLPDQCVDLVVTSPPYNIGIRYNSYADNKDFDHYLDWIRDVMRECTRVLKEDGSIFLNLGERPSDELRAFRVVAQLDFLRLQNTIHWVKSIAAPEHGINHGHYKPVNSRRYLHNAHEYIFHLTKTGAVPLDRLAIGCAYADKSNIGRYAEIDRRSRGNIWFIPYKTVRSGKLHPAAFPEELPQWCIKLHGLDRARLVLDPFMGSGSTALAARKLGVDFIGFEVDPVYVRLAEERLAATGVGREGT